MHFLRVIQGEPFLERGALMIVSSGFGACFEGGGVVQWFVINEGLIKHGFCVFNRSVQALVDPTFGSPKPRNYSYFRD